MNPAFNIWHYSILIMDNCRFAYIDFYGSDFDGVMVKMTADAETQRWCGLVKSLMNSLKTKASGESWSSMEEIFHLS